MSDERIIEEVAARAGVLPSYHDQGGRLIETPLRAKVAVLRGLGFPVDTAEDAERARDRLKTLQDTPVARVIAYASDSPVHLTLQSRIEGAASWSLQTEDGAEFEGKIERGSAAIDLPVQQAGYHSLTLQAGGNDYRSLLVAAPSRCWQPAAIEKGRRGFGFTAQTYGLRSDRQFGIGDYTDLGDLAAGAAKWGASFLGLSPAHALFPADASRYSPYSPSSRLFLQTILIDPAAIAQEAPQSIRRLLNESPDLAATLERARGAALVNYQAAYAAKRRLFEDLWGRFGKSASEEFAAFRANRGESLELHALYDALSEHFAAEGALQPDAWPSAFRDRNSPEVARFRDSHREEIAFHAWLQWIADEQLAAAHNRAVNSGMPIGLYRDLAVGADRAGSEVWCAPTRYLPDMSVGAPPDPLGPQGQDWGLPPFDPLALEDKDLLPFRDLVAANMRHAGALRIDHAFQLQRLFLIPVGAPAVNGAYVKYPLEALLGVLRIESHRAKSMVIAEDLGTTPKGFSEAIMKSGILSYRLLSFERTKSGGFTPPRDYPRDALAAVSTHDLPTFKGWWRGLDVDLRECFGVFDPKLAERERAHRALDRSRFSDVLKDEGLPFSADAGASAAPEEGCLRLLARTSSALAAVQVEDAIGEIQQANLPGLSEGHPNWRRRLSSSVRDLVSEGGPLARASAALAREGRGLSDPPSRLASAPPRATYRFQFNKEFTFEAAKAAIPYLRDLGITHVYASPITKAAPGSMHGYDVNDYCEINPELGGMDGFIGFSDALRGAGLGLIVDFVPNHMGVAGNGNIWWRSVLECGQSSPDANVFDIDFDRDGADGKVLLPVLGKPYAEVLADGELSLDFHAAAGAFVLSYFDQSFPIRPESYPEILSRGLIAAEPSRLSAAIDRFSALTKADGFQLLTGLKEAKAALARDAREAPALLSALEGCAASFDAETSAGRIALHALIERQHYRLGSWTLASSELNYRRFFDVSGLAGVKVEDESVFSAVHELLFALVRENRIQGIRLDHIDGLADPAAYLDRLQGVVGPGFYILVEKILERGEKLRPWPIAGATGYEFLAPLDQIFADRAQAGEFTSLYEQATGDTQPYQQQLIAIKKALLTDAFGGEVNALTRGFFRRARASKYSLDLSEDRLREGLVALIAAFPVYRTYVNTRGPDAADREVAAEAAEGARKLLPPSAHGALDFVVSVLLDGEAEPKRLRLVAGLQQLTGPLMAKSLEDTLFYRYVRLIALNEVGGDPSEFGENLSRFHAAMIDRAANWPAALNTTSTHDTKRGEDARARLLAATSSFPLWRQAYDAFERAVEGTSEKPDPQHAYFLFQSLVAALPLDFLTSSPSQAAQQSFVERAQQFATKALRESKRKTSWTNPDETYERAVLNAIERLADPSGPFLAEASKIIGDFARLGARLAISRLVLKCTLPGVPDFYQGTEFWDFSFVDPDNRRPVNYEERHAALLRFGGGEGLQPTDWLDPRLKQAVAARLLADRAENPELYALGDYLPLPSAGAEDTWIAFKRRRKHDVLFVLAITRFSKATAQDKGLFERTGGPAAIEPGNWRNLLTGETLQITERSNVETLLGKWPALVLRKKL